MRVSAFVFVCFFFASIPDATSQKKLHAADLVYPYLDAANSRWFYFSSASRPFGMVSLFPDTKIDGEWRSGYRYEVDTVRCFSHIHEWQLAGVAVMPVTFSDNDIPSMFNNYSSHFSHDDEVVSPGYHSVILNRFGIRVELTATNHAGFHRYSYPSSGRQGVIIELGGQLGPSEMLEGGFKKIDEQTIEGFIVNGPTVRRQKNCPVYFSAIFNRPVKNIFLFHNGKEVTHINEWTGKNGSLLVEFDNTSTQPLLMKVGISFTNEGGASKNLSTEIPHWEFEKIKEESGEHWNAMLSRIEIEGGSLSQRRRFYTDLAHAIQGRRAISDADGKYADNTGSSIVIRQVPLKKDGKPLFNMYNSDAFWGAQWTLNTLWQLVYPEIAEEFCHSFLEYYKNGGLIPRGPSGGDYTFVMTGASSTPFFVSAWQKGIRGFDIGVAYEGLKKNHIPGGMMSKAGYEHNTAQGGGVELYISKGYVPYPLGAGNYGYHQDGAGMTMEYAYQDWTLAHLAKALGKDDDYKYFLNRSANYKNIFNQESGYIQPKDIDGKWKDPFDPLLYDNGFVEGNATQFTWFVPHDMQGLFQLMGGRDSAVVRLNRQFEKSAWHRFCDEHPEKDPRFINDRSTWINYSNQPNSQAAFIFNHAGAPWLTQFWSREVVNKVFSELSPYYGYNGDEDQGLMGSLSVLMKMGIFQMSGGCEEDPWYEIGSPLFEAITIRLDPDFYKGKSFRIEARNNSDENRYIQRATLNGKSLQSFRFRHPDLAKGGRLVLEMGASPNKSWGLEN